MARDYVGRYDMCFRNLYDTDDTVTVLTGFVGMKICRDCCVVNRGGRKYDIVDLIDAMMEKESIDGGAQE